ncbi:secretory phospholipase A2 receptor-like [Neoarius graeffei]|uniref:secretory phospholipase A2 receptor-like n=1 Tax=Neoarius graeffei TaxID=443677 RepID=UPI00298C8341|nr:secretory phospholipase A2 receptor-like [Neoarius graeffei]
MVTVSLLFLLLSAFSPPVRSRLTAFHFIPRNMTWTEAQTACRESYTDLVTVYSDEDNTELETMMNNTNISDGWIGLHRCKDSGNSGCSEKWSNGDAVTFRNLTGNCGTSNCCAAMKADGAWDWLQCNGIKHFMCYRQDASSKVPKYHLILESKTWYEAQRYCRRNYTDLVSIRNEQQNEEVKTEGSKSNTPFWIGLLCDDWHWSDEGKPACGNRETGQHQNPNECIKLREGKWHSAQCDNTHYALCYSTFIHVSNVSLNWEKALDYCYQENRAGLLKIESAAEQKEVEFELRKKGISAPVWVGLRQSRLFGFWMWPNGNAVFPYSNWDEGKQPEHQLSQHCGAIEPQNEYRWRDMNCLSHYTALCHIKCSA